MSAQSIAHDPPAMDPPDARIRQIELSDIPEVLRLGWRDYQRRPSSILFLFFIYPIIGVLCVYIAFSYDLVGLIYPLIAGFALIGPVAAVGVFELSRRQEAGEDPRLLDAFSVLRRPPGPAIVGVSVILFGLFAAWIIVAQMLLGATLGDTVPTRLPALIAAALTTGGGITLVILGNLIGFCFALAALVIAVVSLPMLVDGETSAGRAIRTSVRAVLANPVPMAGWGVTVAVLLALGMLPVFAGLLIVLPVLGHANWHLYRRVVAH